MNCLVTGSSGFLGSHVVPYLERLHTVKTVSLKGNSIELIDLKQIDVIVHLSGLAHQMTQIDPQLYFDVNTLQTLALAKKAKKSGVKQFIFISTVKVYGDNVGEFFDENSDCIPTDPYGQSKLDAELGLQEVENDDFKVAVIRPPLIYGKGVKGNLDRIMKLCLKLPVLPFGEIHNKRSMVYAGNISALIAKIIECSCKGIFIAGDIKPHSTTALVDEIIKTLKLKTYNFKLPIPFRKLLNGLKPDIYSRLFRNFVIDNSKTNKELNFSPPYSFEEGIENMVSTHTLHK